MKTVLQRVSSASVTVDGSTVGQIGRGVLVLLGFSKEDDERKLDYHVDKLLKLRMFSDDVGKMNLSVTDIEGELLIVSQFTLAGDCRKGTRPSFDSALAPNQANNLYETFIDRLRERSTLMIQTGRFGAMMQVALVNDGPVTFILEN